MIPNLFRGVLAYKHPLFRRTSLSIERLWDLAIIASIIVPLFLFVIELLFTIPHNYSQLFNFIETLSLTILVVDLFAELVNAKNKFIFVRKNWILILAVIPLTRVVEASSSLRLLDLFRVGAHSSKLVEGDMLMDMAVMGGLQKTFKLSKSSSLAKVEKALKHTSHSIHLHKKLKNKKGKFK